MLHSRADPKPRIVRRGSVHGRTSNRRTQSLPLQPINSSTWLRTAWPSCLKLQGESSGAIRRRPRRRWSQHRTSCKRRSSVVRALTAPQGAVWRPGRSLRVRAYIDSNLHRTIHIRDLSAVARRSPAHFSRKFKLAVGESPHAYVVQKASGESLPPDDDQRGITERNSLERWLFGSSTSMQALQTGLWPKSGQLATRARNP